MKKVESQTKPPLTQQLRALEDRKSDIEAAIDAIQLPILGARQLKDLLRQVAQRNFRLDQPAPIDLIRFLIRRSHLEKIEFKTPRVETLYTWRTADPYQLMPTLRPNGYYTHMTALHLHGLLDQEPNSIYFNQEQPARSSLGHLEQARIDAAFQRQQRVTSARTTHRGKVYWLLNGKQTGSRGVVMMNAPSGAQIAATGLERTLIDIAVRPAYAGGTKSVLLAYRQAQPRVSIAKLSRTLRALNFVYPYHQSVGFYIEAAGNYADKAIRTFMNFQPFEFDFYLDYGMQSPAYSTKWRIHYPSNLT